VRAAAEEQAAALRTETERTQPCAGQAEHTPPRPTQAAALRTETEQHAAHVQARPSSTPPRPQHAMTWTTQAPAAGRGRNGQANEAGGTLAAHAKQEAQSVNAQDQQRRGRRGQGAGGRLRPLATQAQAARRYGGGAGPEAATLRRSPQSAAVVTEQARQQAAHLQQAAEDAGQARTDGGAEAATAAGRGRA